MNVYDHAHSLARSIKESPEYKEYIRLKQELSKNEDLKNMLADFQQKQIEIQTQQMLGNQPEGGMMEQIQSLYQIIVKDPKAAEYMQSEMMFTRMITDIYGILGEVIRVE